MMQSFPWHDVKHPPSATFLSPAYLQRIALGIILLVAVGVRVYQFGSIPSGLHQDEIATAYDAYSLLHYGIDRNGFRLPLFLVSWGSGMSALPAYIEALFFAIGGASSITVRAGQLLLNLSSLLIFPLLVKKVRGDGFAILCAFLLAIMPWHIMISRWALDENFFPGIFLMGVFFQILACQKQSYLPFAFLFFGLSFYTHGASYFTVPAYVGLSMTYLLWHRRFSWKIITTSIILFFLLALPVGLSLLINHFHLGSLSTPWITIPMLSGVPRYMTVSSIFSDPVGQLIPHLRRFWDFLFVQADYNIFSAVPGYGLIYLMNTPIALLGICLVASRVRLRTFQMEVFFLLWLLVCIGLAALLEVNVNRMNVLLFPLVFFWATGVEFFRRNRPVFITLILTHIVLFVGFTQAYFTTYPPQVAPAFYTSFDRAIALVSAEKNGTVCVTTANMNMPYIYVLFEQKIDPHVFLNTVVYENPGEEFQRVRSFDRYVFGLEHCPHANIAALIARKEEVLPMAILNSQEWLLTEVDAFTVARRRPNTSRAESDMLTGELQQRGS